MGPDDTVHLFEDAFDGDDEARNELLQRLRPRIVLWVAARMSPALRAKDEPDDLAQEVLIAVSKSFDRFDNREYPAFMGWLFTIAEHRIRDRVDYHKAKRRQPPEPVEGAAATTPSVIAVRNERIEHVREKLARLSQDYRDVIRLRLLQDLDCKQVAELMGRSENAVRVLYCRALKALGRELGGSA